MDSIHDDILHLNEKLMLAISVPEEGARILRLLEGNQEVTSRLISANAQAIGTAIRCGIPLVTFTGRIEKLLLSAYQPRMGAAESNPAELQELTYFALELARGLSACHLTFVQLNFGLTKQAASALGAMGLKHVMELSRRRDVLLRLRAATQPEVWDRLLIGERCDGLQAHRISQQAAFGSVGRARG